MKPSRSIICTCQCCCRILNALDNLLPLYCNHYLDLVSEAQVFLSVSGNINALMAWSALTDCLTIV